MTERYARGLGDTNILIQLEWLNSEHMPIDLLISTVTLAELAAGVHSAADARERARRIARLQRTEAVFDPLPFDTESARQYGIIAGEVISAGRKPRGRVADLMIASVAAANKLPLFTTNPDDYRALDAAVTVVPVPVPAQRQS
jgi:predicted nucleic acid-binding protein